MDQLPEPLRRYIEARMQAFGDYRFQEGYAKAKAEDAADASAKGAPAGAEHETPDRGAREKNNTKRKRLKRAALPAAERGSAPALVSGHLKSVAPKPVTRNDIVKAVANHHGVRVAFISVKRALDDLVSEGKAVKVDDRSWRWDEEAAPALRAVS
jgi:hypothetical protein